MDYLPLFFQLKGRQCLVVGGGDVAARKAALLAQAGGKLRVVAPKVCSALNTLVSEKGGEIHLADYNETYLDGVELVVAATNRREVNEQVSKDAQQRQTLVNVVDQPDLCNFILPAIIDRSPVVIGVSSGGQSPVLARMIRAKLETTIPAAYGELGQLVGSFRDKVKTSFSNITQRRQFWEEILNGPVAEMVFAGKSKEASHMLEKKIADSQKQDSLEVGEVYLVGGGPGDPDLLTFRALRLMQQADVVLYDRLVSPQVLELVRRDAERIYVGKAKSNHALPQDEINSLLVKLAKQGKRVCRLKGGDPFIFGRGGEEIETLFEEHIPFQVVPGITAASGCSAYSGIPLTHRDYSQSVRFVTGHLKEGATDLDWETLAKERQTLVFYMGLTGLDTICKKLIEHGLPTTTPIALIQQGTTPNQKVFTGELSNFARQIAETEVHAPTLIIVGEVIRLREKLDWFGRSTHA